MAVFNGQRYLHDQLRSILIQIADDDEVIIVDDCSRDASVDLIRSIGDARISLLQNDVNIGPAASFERALVRARGQYIFLSDQDDVWRPERVAAARRVFRATDALVIVSDARIVDAERNLVASSFFALRQSGPGFWRNLYKNGFVGCCMAIRSETKAFALPFPVKVALHDEWIGLCSQIAGHVSFIDQQLIDYRRHEKNFTRLDHGSVPAMVRKRVSLLFLVIRRLPRILKWRLTST